MASASDNRMHVSEAEFRDLFGDSDSGSHIEFYGFDVSGSDGETDEENDEENGTRVVDEQWTQQLLPIVVEEFDAQTGKRFTIPDNASQLDVFSVLFDDKIVGKIVTETNLYAQQTIAQNPGRNLNWKDTTAREIKAFFGVSIIMGLNSLPIIADYWASDPCLGNEEVKKVMTKNRFESISRFLHFNDSSAAPKRDEPNFDRKFSSRSDNTRKRSLRADAAVPVAAENAADHFCARREGKGRKRECVQCKKDGRQTQGGNAVQTVYECVQCGLALCQEPCFLRFHSA